MPLVTRRQYKGAAAQTTITSSLSSSATSITIAATTGWPTTASVPFYVVIDPGTAVEEKCSATISGSTLTLTRGVDDTTAHAHSSGATIYPVFSAVDADEANFLASRYTTKGDVVVFNGTDVTRVGVGANNTVLTADSAETAGVKWATVGGGSTMALKWQSGGVYLHPGKWNTGVILNEDFTYYSPLYTPEAVTLDRIIIHTSTTFSGTATARLGLYQSNSSGQPGTLILDAGTVSCTAANTQYTVTISQSVSAGFFWLAVNTQTVATTNSFYSYNNVGSPENLSFYHPRGQSNTSITNLGHMLGYYQTGVTGAFGNASGVIAVATVPTIAVRVA